ncbi:MAG: hypothetical protein ACPGRW_09630, partial [Flavobacteriaceae bacterium]
IRSSTYRYQIIKCIRLPLNELSFQFHCHSDRAQRRGISCFYFPDYIVIPISLSFRRSKATEESHKLAKDNKKDEANDFKN